MLCASFSSCCSDNKGMLCCVVCATGHMCWAIQNNAKTDRNIFFGSKNLRALADNLDQADVGGCLCTLRRGCLLPLA